MSNHPVHDAEAVAAALEGASNEDIGRECARRCLRALEMTAEAKTRAKCAESVLEAGEATAVAIASAALCRDYGNAAVALLGNADVETMMASAKASRDADVHAGVAKMHYEQMKRARFGDSPNA